MITVLLVVLGCLYVSGIIIAAGDAWIDGHYERIQARDANMPILRYGAEARAEAARKRFGWSPLWPVLLVRALWRLRDESYPGRTR